MLLKRFDEWAEDNSVYTYNDPGLAFSSSILITKLDVGDALIPEPDGKFITHEGKTILIYEISIDKIAKALKKSYFETLKTLVALDEE